MRQIVEVLVVPRCGHSFLSSWVAPRGISNLFELVTYTKAVWRKRLCSDCRAAKLSGRREP